MTKKNVYSKKRTNKDIDRKYYKQMTPLEIDYLVKQVNQITSVRLTDHAWDKVNYLDIDLFQLREFLGNIKAENIIEYNTGKYHNEKRIVVEDKTPIRADDGTLVKFTYVIEINKEMLITCWMNNIYDNHQTIDMSAYNKNLKII
jgi:hypothetical protein